MIDVGYCYDPIFLEHDSPGHPEHAGRLRAIMSLLRKKNALESLTPLSFASATFDELTSLHSPLYVSQVYAICERGGGGLNPDTYLNKHSFNAAATAVGAAMRAANAVMRNEVKRAFALVRPPGHHAYAGHGEGFCLFNNIAFATKTALGEMRESDAMWSPSAKKSHAQEMPRAMIVDFDVHHGNGTQDIFHDDPGVLFISLHQYGYIYPGTGHHEDVGHGAGRGATINVPMPAYASDQAYARVFEEIVAPAARRFKPSVLLVSAGFDGHWRDPLASISLSLGGFAHLCKTLCDLSDELCDGKLVAILEGGYDLEALSYGVLNMLHIMQGEYAIEDPIGQSPDVEDRADKIIDLVKRTHGL